MGLKGYRLWVMSQLDSTCRAPPRVVYVAHRVDLQADGVLRVAAAQGEFETHMLKPLPVYDIQGVRVKKTSRLQAMGKQSSTCTGGPHHVLHLVRVKQRTGYVRPAGLALFATLFICNQTPI
jgi:hypothetical protein